MKDESNLYQALYQSVLTQIYSGVIRRGERFPSQKELCQLYNVGITTVRKVTRMLEQDGFIKSVPGKRAEVSFDESDHTYSRALLQRRQGIIDIYGGMSIVLPALYAQGARRLTDCAGLREILDTIGDRADYDRIYQQAVRFFSGLLLPFQNQIIFDLESDMESYARIPYLPSPELANPFILASRDTGSNLLSIFPMVERKETEALVARLEQIYLNMQRRVGKYLDALEQKLQEPGGEVPYQWFARKSRAPLYAKVARSLYQRARAGHFSDRAYLPSVPELMKTYGIAKVTACNAVALLSDIGFIRTLDKRGIVLRESGKLPPIRLEEKIIRDNLIYFLDTLQILAICSKRLSYAAARCLEESGLEEVRLEWERAGTGPAGRIVQILVCFLRDRTPYSCLQNILGQLDDFLIWGLYLGRFKAVDSRCLNLEKEISQRYADLCAALARGDLESFSEAVQAVFGAAYSSARIQSLLSCAGISDRVPAAL